jgi:hypothetical protein
MDLPTIAGISAIGLGTGMNSFAGLFDDSHAEKAGLMRDQAKMTQSAFEETMRRAEGQQTQVLSSTEARMGATGFSTDSGSFQQYLTGMASEFHKQNDFSTKQNAADQAMRYHAADIEESQGNFLHKMTSFVGSLAGGAAMAAALV